jgi:anti-anti-sigma factor
MGRVMTEAVALQLRRLIIDLGDAPTVDAAAIAILLQAHQAMVQAGGRLVLRRPVDRVRRMLRVARVDEVFAVEGAETTERNRAWSSCLTMRPLQPSGSAVTSAPPWHAACGTP